MAKKKSKMTDLGFSMEAKFPKVKYGSKSSVKKMRTPKKMY